jgi:hypothetical protein
MARAATSDEAESTAETDETALAETRRVEISSRGAPIFDSTREGDSSFGVKNRRLAKRRDRGPRLTSRM